MEILRISFGQLSNISQEKGDLSFILLEHSGSGPALVLIAQMLPVLMMRQALAPIRENGSETASDLSS